MKYTWNVVCDMHPPMVRNYYIINDGVCEHLGYNKYITQLVPATDIVLFNISLARNSDRIIAADSRGIKYVKNRYGPLTEPIDPDELTFIILSSTEDVFR